MRLLLVICVKLSSILWFSHSFLKNILNFNLSNLFFLTSNVLLEIFSYSRLWWYLLHLRSFIILTFMYSYSPSEIDVCTWRKVGIRINVHSIVSLLLCMPGSLHLDDKHCGIYIVEYCLFCLLILIVLMCRSPLSFSDSFFILSTILVFDCFLHHHLTSSSPFD